MKDEIISGLRNAMNHGSSLEQAVRSFINAGYNSQEVQESARIISSGVSGLVYAPESGRENKENELPPLPSEKNEKKKSHGKTWLVIVLIVVLLGVLGGIGLLLYGILKG